MGWSTPAGSTKMTGLGEGPRGDQGERERGGVGGSESGCGT